MNASSPTSTVSTRNEAQLSLVEYPLLADVFDRSLRKSVVLITSASADNAGFGTGFIIEQSNDSALIVTCAHVVRDVGGVENVLVGGRRASMIADGEPARIDIAILKVAGLVGQPLRLRTTGQQGSRFRTIGFQAYTRKFLLRPLEGVLGEQVGLQDPSQHQPIPAWDLLDVGPQGLRDGYSGSPVIDKRTGDVLGVLSHRQGERAGLAISVEAIATVFPEARIFSDQVDHEETSREHWLVGWLMALLLFLHFETLLCVLGMSLPLLPQVEWVEADGVSVLLSGASVLLVFFARHGLHTALLWLRGMFGLLRILTVGTAVLAGLAFYNHKHLFGTRYDASFFDVATKAANWDIAKTEESLRQAQFPPVFDAFIFSVAARKATGKTYPEQERILAAEAGRGKPLFTRAVAYIGLANLALASGNVERAFVDIQKALGLTGWFQSRLANKFILKQAGVTYLSLVGVVGDKAKAAEILREADDTYVALLALVDDDSGVEAAHILDRRAVIAYYGNHPSIARENWKNAIERLSSAAATLGDAYNNMAIIDMSDGAWSDALPRLRISEALGTGDVRTTQINQLICHAQLGRKAEAELLIVQMEGTVRNLAEHAVHGMVYKDERSLGEYAKALGRATLSRGDLTPALYQRLAALCRESFWGLSFEPSQFEIVGEEP